MRTLSFLIAFLYACGASAQEFPTKPLQIVIPFAAGSSTYIVFNLMAPTLNQRLGQPVLIVPRPGGMATIGMGYVARANPDGYTLGAATLSFAANAPFMEEKMPYNPQRDFAPITQVTRATLVLIVNPGIGVRNVKELIALARTKPGALNYGSTGIATSGHLAGALFASAARLKVVHIPFTGGIASVSLASGTTQFQITPIPASFGLVKAGRVLPIGVTSTKRVSAYPDVPTISEAGLPGFEMYEWAAVLAPAKTPAAVIRRLQQELVYAATEPSVKAKIEDVGTEVVTGTPEQLAAHLKSEFAIWRKVATEVNEAEK
jgi:tripartite-type tricarboxylate transporter receptor subunit TctC